MKTLDRRTVLRGAGGVALALPWLEAMGLPGGGTARAASPSGFPKRFMVFFTPNGTIQENLLPGGGPTSLDLSTSQILSPLQDYKDYINVLAGITNEAANHGPGDGHQTGMGCMLTCTELLPGTLKGGCDTCAAAGYANGPSVDQVIVQKSNAKTKFPSLELGIQSFQLGTPWGYSNYAASNMPLPLQNSPHNTFQRVFTDLNGVGPDPNALAKLKTERKSVLDTLAAHYQMLSARVGKSDKMKLDAHMASIRDLEQRLLSSTAVASTACTKPVDPGTANDPQTSGRLQADLLIAAMACDLTRVGTIQWEHSTGELHFTWLGATRGHHTMSHDPDSNLDTKAMLTKINNWLAAELAYIVKKLKSIPEGTGTMLDNTLILWCNELARGNTHSRNNEVYVTVGRAGGAVKAGRFLKFPTKTNTNDLMVSILNAFDIPVTTFGNPAYCTGPLAGF